MESSVAAVRSRTQEFTTQILYFHPKRPQETRGDPRRPVDPLGGFSGGYPGGDPWGPPWDPGGIPLGDPPGGFTQGIGIDQVRGGRGGGRQAKRRGKKKTSLHWKHLLATSVVSLLCRSFIIGAFRHWKVPPFGRLLSIDGGDRSGEYTGWGYPEGILGVYPGGESWGGILGVGDLIPVRVGP
jgi:hypothetical protein